MIFFQLFWAFFKIGLFTIGGGHAMIPLIMREVVAKGWLTEELLIDFIAVAESTPGPFAVNIATYTGIEVAGIVGSAAATFGVVLPSLIIIILIVKVFSSFIKKKPVQDTFRSVRSSVTGLLASVFMTLLLTIIFGVTSIWNTSNSSADFIGIGIFVVLFSLSFVKIKGKKIQPIFLILIAALLGIVCYGFIPV